MVSCGYVLSEDIPALHLYRGGHLLPLIHHYNKHKPPQPLTIHTLHTSKEHIALSLSIPNHGLSCAVVLDLVPSSVTVPSLYTVRRFFNRLKKGLKWYLEGVLTFYLRSPVVGMHVITNSDSCDTAASLLLCSKSGYIYIFTYSTECYEWRLLTSTNICIPRQKSCESYVSTVEFHPRSLVLFWVEYEVEDSSVTHVVRSCTLPSFLRSACGSDEIGDNCSAINMNGGLCDSPFSPSLFSPEYMAVSLLRVPSCQSPLSPVTLSSDPEKGCWIVAHGVEEGKEACDLTVTFVDLLSGRLQSHPLPLFRAQRIQRLTVCPLSQSCVPGAAALVLMQTTPPSCLVATVAICRHAGLTVLPAQTLRPLPAGVSGRLHSARVIGDHLVVLFGRRGTVLSTPLTGVLACVIPGIGVRITEKDRITWRVVQHCTQSLIPARQDETDAKANHYSTCGGFWGSTDGSCGIYSCTGGMWGMTNSNTPSSPLHAFPAAAETNTCGDSLVNWYKSRYTDSHVNRNRPNKNAQSSSEHILYLTSDGDVLLPPREFISSFMSQLLGRPTEFRHWPLGSAEVEDIDNTVCNNMCEEIGIISILLQISLGDDEPLIQRQEQQGCASSQWDSPTIETLFSGHEELWLEKKGSLGARELPCRYLDLQELTISCTDSSERHTYLELVVEYVAIYRPCSLWRLTLSVLRLVSYIGSPSNIPSSTSLTELCRSSSSARAMCAVLVRCIAAAEEAVEKTCVTHTSTSDTRCREDAVLRLLSLSGDMSGVVARMLRWGRSQEAVKLCCSVFDGYNTSRVRAELGVAAFSSGVAIEELRTMTEEEDSGGDWGGTWKDASVSSGDDEEELEGETSWRDVHTGDEGVSEGPTLWDTPWSIVAYQYREMFLPCLRTLLRSLDIDSACRLISCRPSPSLGGKGPGGGVTDKEIVELFEQVRHSQMTEITSLGGDDFDSESVLHGEHLRQLIGSLKYIEL